ncbi:hypothetical protein D3H64_06170 [Atopobacter sp. AH10]|uniref:hypothetical protein n=1 Tax=Atopobacter sp. AH10 TaxID=2315861 RepID=UPI000EF1BF48|nr:hypothetical protein [Atopobacter sp. AH10]RLK63175.1 hypothetical protein D3H64_06170 [Atopobacter sp. AH10]
MSHEKKPITQRIMEFLREHPHATNDEIAETAGITNKRAADTLSVLNIRGWVDSSYNEGKRTIIVKWKPKDTETVKELRQNTYYEMLPKALETYEEATNVQDLNVAAKIIFRILENL